MAIEQWLDRRADRRRDEDPAREERDLRARKHRHSEEGADEEREEEDVGVTASRVGVQGPERGEDERREGGDRAEETDHTTTQTEVVVVHGKVGEEGTQ